MSTTHSNFSAVSTETQHVGLTPVSAHADDTHRRFEKLRGSPKYQHPSATSAFSHQPESVFTFASPRRRDASPPARPTHFPTAEQISLSADQLALLKSESFARGGSLMNYLHADYALHRRCPLPPAQARFEASFIYTPLVSGNMSSGDRLCGEGDDEALDHHTRDEDHAFHLAGLDERHSRNKVGSAMVAPNPAVHFGHQGTDGSASALLRDTTRQNFADLYYHTDFFHLAADYDLHRQSGGLPMAEAKFFRSFVFMPDRDAEKRVLKELAAEFPHLGITIA